MADTPGYNVVAGWLDETDKVALRHFSHTTRVEVKPDGTPVTEADRSIEKTLREAILGVYPDDAILGEEYGESGSSGRRWIIDPIDGTKNYARGVPIFATLIALESDGELVLGAVSAPALRTRWWATRGGGAFRDGDPIAVSDVASLEEAEVCTGDIGYAERQDQALRLLAGAKRWRGFGDFWGHMLVAQGSMDAMIEFASLALWDIAACKIIVEEAGGEATGLDGDGALRAGPLVTSNGRVHGEILRRLG